MPSQDGLCLSLCLSLCLRLAFAFRDYCDCDRLRLRQLVLISFVRFRLVLVSRASSYQLNFDIKHASLHERRH